MQARGTVCREHCHESTRQPELEQQGRQESEQQPELVLREVYLRMPQSSWAINCQQESMLTVVVLHKP